MIAGIADFATHSNHRRIFEVIAPEHPNGVNPETKERRAPERDAEGRHDLEGRLNLAEVAVITVVVLLEKVVPGRLKIGMATGVLFIAWGAWMIAAG